LIGALYNANNVKVGQAALLVAPPNTACPLPTTFDLADPFDLTVFQTGAPPFAWQPCGATDQGWTWAMNKTTQEITIEEQSTPLNTLVTAQTVTVTGALSEDIAKTLAMVFNMLTTVVAPTVSTPGYSALSLTDNTIEYAVALIMANNLGFPRVLYIPATTCLGNVSTVLRRAAAKRMYTAAFNSVCPTTSIQVFDITAPHS
jgi:hypothetical protein